MKSNPIKHLKLRVSGRVQGVSFRSSARKVAERLNLQGFARNEPDGSVYVEVEGDPVAIEQFTAWCKEGPEAAVVKSIQQVEGEPAGHQGFSRL